MRCERVQEFFSDYLENRLDSPLRVSVDGHLHECAGCRQEVEQLRDTFVALGATPEVEPPQALAMQVMRRIQHERAERIEAQRRATGWLPWLRSLRPARVAAVAGLGTMMIAGAGLYTATDRWFGVPLPGISHRPATLGVGSVAVTYSEVGPRQATLTLTPSASLNNAQVAIGRGGSTLLGPGNRGRMDEGKPYSWTVDLGTQPEIVTMRVSAGNLAAPQTFTFALPSGIAPATSVNLTLYDATGPAALAQLAERIGQPIVVEGPLPATVTAQVTGETASEALDAVLGPQGYAWTQDGQVYRVTRSR